MSEWFKEAVLKTAVRQRTVGSNPTLSDIFKGVSAFNLDLSAYGAVFSGETDDQDGEKT